MDKPLAISPWDFPNFINKLKWQQWWLKVSSGFESFLVGLGLIAALAVTAYGLKAVIAPSKKNRSNRGDNSAEI